MFEYSSESSRSSHSDYAEEEMESVGTGTKGEKLKYEYAMRCLKIQLLIDVVGTLLHELVHNEFGPHDKKFKNLLKEITAECEILLSLQYGLHVTKIEDCGFRLGGDTEATTKYTQRELAAFAAESRLALSISACFSITDNNTTVYDITKSDDEDIILIE